MTVRPVRFVARSRRSQAGGTRDTCSTTQILTQRIVLDNPRGSRLSAQNVTLSATLCTGKSNAAVGSARPHGYVLGLREALPHDNHCFESSPIGLELATSSHACPHLRLQGRAFPAIGFWLGNRPNYLMVSPRARRGQVGFQHERGLPQRCACGLLDVPRSTPANRGKVAPTNPSTVSSATNS